MFGGAGYSPYGLPSPNDDHNMPMRLGRHVPEGCPYRKDDVMDAEEAVKTGTTIMAVEFDGGVVVGADTRTSTGDYVANRASRKISRVHERIFVCRCGSAADTQALTKFVQHYYGMHAIELGDMPTVNTAASLFTMIAYNNKDHLMAGLIVAGYDDKRGGQVFSIPLGGSMIRVPMAIDGSGSGYISAFCDANYKPGMTKAEALAFVQRAVSHAMSRDGSSGGLVRTCVITKDGIEEGVIEGNKLPVAP